MDRSVLVCSDSLLFFLRVAVKRAQIDIAGGLVDPLLLAVGLKAFVDDHCSK